MPSPTRRRPHSLRRGPTLPLLPPPQILTSPGKSEAGRRSESSARIPHFKVRGANCSYLQTPLAFTFIHSELQGTGMSLKSNSIYIYCPMGKFVLDSGSCCSYTRQQQNNIPQRQYNSIQHMKNYNVKIQGNFPHTASPSHGMRFHSFLLIILHIPVTLSQSHNPIIALSNLTLSMLIEVNQVGFGHLKDAYR